MDELRSWTRIGSARVTTDAWSAATSAVTNGGIVHLIGPTSLGRDDLENVLRRLCGANVFRYHELDRAGNLAWTTTPGPIIVAGPSYYDSDEHLVAITAAVSQIDPDRVRAALDQVAVRIVAEPVADALFVHAPD